MAREQVLVDAPAETVFAVLSDPRPYAFFVVGTKRIRRFDPGWPAHGAALHHTVGVGPFVLRDATRAVEVDPPRRLLLHAGLRPLGTTQITFTLVSVGERTEVVMEEWPIDGPVARMWNRALDRLLGLRNRELLRRLQRLAERREQRRAQLSAPPG